MITSTSNSHVKKTRALQSQRKARVAHASFVLEGERLMREIVLTQTPVDFVLHTEVHLQKRRGLLNTLAKLGGDILQVSDKVMEVCSLSETPPGILAVVPQPDWSSVVPNSSALIIDRLADPGNLGTILRTAFAAGVEAVFFTKGTVDPFNPKVVRGAMGAQLRLPILPLSMEGIHQLLPGLSIWIAGSKEGIPYYDIDWADPFALVIGSEAGGVDPSFLQLCKGRTCIPMQGEIDSLNAGVAAGIILFETVRQRGTR